MEYYFSKTINDSFENAIEKVTAALKVEGFGTNRNRFKSNIKKETGCRFYNYTILGACNPACHKALLAEDKIGTMLPCNVIVQEKVKVRSFGS
jgi:uncharacterized protein (DUF302 family)